MTPGHSRSGFCVCAIVTSDNTPLGSNLFPFSILATLGRMSYFAGDARIKTAVLFASTFLAISCLFGFATQFMGIAGAIFMEAMITGSPFCWLNGPVKFFLRLSPALLYPLALAPYALLGWLIGYYWPLRDASVVRLLRAVVLRFLVVWFPIVAIGIWRGFSN